MSAEVNAQRPSRSDSTLQLAQANPPQHPQATSHGHFQQLSSASDESFTRPADQTTLDSETPLQFRRVSSSEEGSHQESAGGKG